MSKKTKIILVAVIVLVIVAMALYPVVKRAFGGTDETATGPVVSRAQRALSVNAQILGYESLSDEFKSLGRLLPDEEVALSFETSGKITDIFFQEGSHVKKGEVLAKVNDKPLQAELKKLQAQIPLAEDRVSRQKTLLSKDAVSQESYESVVTEHEELLADIELAKARIEQTQLTAPFDGMIGLRNVSEGAYATPTTVITTLTRISPLKVEFSVNERQVNDLGDGTVIEFTTGSDPTKMYRAAVYAIESRLDENTITLKARARYDNPGGVLKPGQSVSINMTIGQYGRALLIPSMATLAEMGRDLAYVYDNGVARQVVVKKGMRTDTSVQITEGLSLGDTLITTGVMQLRDGMPVEINQLSGGVK